jgi:hypothetical protein
MRWAVLCVLVVGCSKESRVASPPPVVTATPVPVPPNPVPTLEPTEPIEVRPADNMGSCATQVNVALALARKEAHTTSRPGAFGCPTLIEHDVVLFHDTPPQRGLVHLDEAQSSQRHKAALPDFCVYIASLPCG